MSTCFSISQVSNLLESLLLAVDLIFKALQSGSAHISMSIKIKTCELRHSQALSDVNRIVIFFPLLLCECLCQISLGLYRFPLGPRLTYS